MNAHPLPYDPIRPYYPLLASEDDEISALFNDEHIYFTANLTPANPFRLRDPYVPDLRFQQVACNKCGETRLEVAQADRGHLTAVRCPRCDREECIHEG
jgi:ribosomal protein S27E